MRKTLSAIALLLLLAMGVVVNSLRPAPGTKAREAVGNNAVMNTVATGAPTVEFHQTNGAPLIVLHPSLGRQASDFNELVISLSKYGYGTKTIEPAGISKVAIKQDLPKRTEIQATAIPIARAIDLREAVIIGHAYGNRVARMTAHQYPDRVKAVILLAAGGQVPMQPKAEQSLKNIFNPLRTYRSRVKDVHHAFFADGNDIPTHWKRGWHTKTAMAQVKAVQASADDDSWHCAGGVPMLIVQPMQDRIAPIENAYALHDKCPQEVEIVEVQNAGHALLPEQPEAVAKAVLDFLAKHHPIPPE